MEGEQFEMKRCFATLAFLFPLKGKRKGKSVEVDKQWNLLLFLLQDGLTAHPNQREFLNLFHNNIVHGPVERVD